MSDVLPYRREVDGLRAIAVLAVIAFHAGLKPVRGGFVGVDVFFVISGFLICGILLRESAAGALTLTGFYARRMRRILPALAVVVLACLPFAAWLLPREPLADFTRMVAAVALAGSNLLLAATTGYFDQPAEDRPLLHTWSLGVEEQFYFLFPLIVLWAARRGPHVLARWLWVIAAFSLGAAEWGWRHHSAATFFLTPGRAWELLAGCLAACALHSGTSWVSRVRGAWREALSIGGLVLVVASCLAFRRSTPTPSVWLLLPVLGTVAILLWGTSETWTGRCLASKPLVAVGLVSYSAYLWHQPLLAFARVANLGPLGAWQRSALVCATFALAALTWKFVEQPLRSARRWPDRRALASGAACIAVLCSAGLGGWLAVQAWAPRLPDAVRAAFAPPPRSAECFDIDRAHERETGWSCAINPQAGAATFMLAGDSHALQLLDAFEAAARDAGRAGIFAGFSGCAPLLGTYPVTRGDQATHDCHALNERMLAEAKARGIRDVWLVAKWSYYTNTWQGGYLNALALEPGGAQSIDASRHAFAVGFASTVRAYTAAGMRVHVLEQVPQQRVMPEALYERAWKAGGDMQRTLDDWSTPRAANEALQSYAGSVFRSAVAGATWQVHTMDDLFCDRELCRIGTPAQPWYIDLSHLSAPGAQRLVPRLAGTLKGGG